MLARLPSGLLRMPTSPGMRPVIMLYRDGRQTGLAQYARSKRTPLAAILSMAGVRT